MSLKQLLVGLLRLMELRTNNLLSIGFHPCFSPSAILAPREGMNVGVVVSMRNTAGRTTVTCPAPGTPRRTVEAKAPCMSLILVSHGLCYRDLGKSWIASS